MKTADIRGLLDLDDESMDPEVYRPVKRLKYGLVFLLQVLVWAMLYYAINRATEGSTVLQPMLPYEEKIPRVSAAYPVYMLAYLQVFLPLFLARSRLQYFQVQAAFVLASLVAFAVFLLAPMPYPRPPLQVDGFFDWLLFLEYSSDGSACTFPSLHVAFVWILYLGFRHRSKSWRALLLLSAIAVSLSTVLVKQHFLVDLPAGMALAAACWCAAPALTRWVLRPPAVWKPADAL